MTMRRPPSLAVVVCYAIALPLRADDETAVIVADHGGVSALPYYRALNLQSPTGGKASPPTIPGAAAEPIPRVTESAFLPVHSARLTPGAVKPKVIAAPGLQPFFLIGDDSASRTWLHGRLHDLRALGAIGLVVEVQTASALDELRKMAPGIMLVATPADDLAQRLGLTHYPVLITATAIEP